MSVIQTIRNKYGKIAGAVIAIALIGFIISDARNGSFGNFFGGRDSNVMVINGTKIDPKDYQVHLKEYETLYTMFNKGRPLDDATRTQMNEQVVQSLVYETIADEQCEKLGIQTSDEEKKALIYGENADPLIRQFQIDGQQVFINQQTGAFDPQIIKSMEKELAENAQKIDPTGKIREQWETVKAYVISMSNVNKFNALITGSVYVPLYMAKRVVTDQNSRAAIKFVKVPYTSVADNEVNVTDQEIKDYMQKHGAMYVADQPNRSIEYVSFDIVPSTADTNRQLDALAEIKSDFATAKDNKAFVNNKSDEANSFNEAYLNKRTFTSRYADTIMSLPVGGIYGPYYENGSVKLTKVVDRQTLPDSVKCRQILVKTKDHDKDVATDSAAMNKLDSAIADIKKGVSWDSVAARYSEDDGSKDKGGEYTFTLLQRPGISKEFGDFIFEGKTGDAKTVKVSNDNYHGYHYIEILDQKGIGPSVQLATVSKILAPSDSTVSAIYGKANEFAGKNPTAAEFDAAVKKLGYDKRVGDNVKINSFSIPGLGAAREIVRWMYEHKLGDISGVFQLGDQRYVVAKLSDIEDKGPMGITEANRQVLEQKVKEEKKADVISKKYTGAASLDAIAQTSSQQVQESDSVTLGGGYIPGLGFEPRVTGYSFYTGFQVNTVSPGIKGQGGVYFITVLNREMNPIDASLMNMIAPQQQRSLENQLRNAVGQQIQPSLIKMADVKYNVDNF